MGSCSSRPILHTVEDIFFAIGSIYSIILSYVSSFVNRFYAFLLSPFARVDETHNVPSTLCDEQSGVCLRPKSRLRHKGKLELRMRRAELAARGLDPSLAMKANGSATPRASISDVVSQPILKRWSRAESAVVTPSGSPVMDINAEDGEWMLLTARTDGGRASIDQLRTPTRSNTAPVSIVPSKSAPFGPFHQPQRTPSPLSASATTTALKDQVSRGQTTTGPLVKASNSDSQRSGQQLPPSQTNPHLRRLHRSGPKASVPPSTSYSCRTSVDLSALESDGHSPVRRSLDVPPGMSALQRIQTMPLIATANGSSSQNLIYNSSAEASPRGSISDLAAAACNAACNKKDRKAWRQELDKVAKNHHVKASPLSSGQSRPVLPSTILAVS